MSYKPISEQLEGYKTIKSFLFEFDIGNRPDIFKSILPFFVSGYFY